MEIKRLQIEGGFLDGFDVSFADGLNVLIGARGTGKTSVIELLRFALEARNHTAESATRSAEHTAAVLKDGTVSVELHDLLDRVSVTRSIGQDETQTSGDFSKPLVFSQTEIENLGLSDNGRLRLLDNFVTGSSKLAAEEAAAVTSIKSIFKEISAAEADRLNLENGLDGLMALAERITALEKQEFEYRASSADLAEKQTELRALNSSISSAVVGEGMLERFSDAARRWTHALSGLVSDDFGAEDWDPEDGNDPLREFRASYSKLVGEVRALGSQFENLSQKASANREELVKARLAIEGQARAVRAEVEQSVTGAGAVSRQLSFAKTEMAQLQSRRRLVEERMQRINQLRARRDDRIRILDAVRSERFARREKVAKSLTKALSPQVKVSVVRYGQYAEYAKALTDSLRGSGMRYADLVTALTEAVSPQELVHFIDSNDFMSLSDIASIPKDRAARLLGHLRENGAADIVVASIEDDVRMSLLDGVDYKDVENLSAGQRCTVILSIILQHTSRTLIIDQPEDHLDNAYIATTVIKAIRNRKAHGQLIISTHNANIPVLGGADLVIEMTSDGRNGFVQVCDQLESPIAVEAITNVMEGGREAFESRASFYETHDI